MLNRIVNAERSASYYKQISHKLRQQLKSGSICEVENLKEHIKKKHLKIEILSQNIEELTEQLGENASTKNADGSFTDNSRLIEIAVEKI